MKKNFWLIVIVIFCCGGVVNAYDIKWSQPPQINPSSPYPDCFWGWDEVSIYDGPQIVGDDWLCEDDHPIIGIRWWGSYVDWDIPIPPDPAPVAFHIGIWTDIPAGGAEPFSHPDLMVWETYVSYMDANEMPIGCDYYPGHAVDTCFQYEVLFDQVDWFYQEPGPTVYWVTISALYDVIPPFNPWGWKTREHYYNDDAIRIFNPVSPTTGTIYIVGEPIEEPPGVSWDMSFELFTEDAPTATPTETPVPTNTAAPTDTPVPTETSIPTDTPIPTETPTLPPDVKWSQEPQFYAGSPFPQCYWGWDEVSLIEFGPIIADDWLCLTEQPVTGVRWWGSYLGWDLPFSPSIVPDLFHIAIWTDVPAGGSEPFSHPDMVVWEGIVPYFEATEMEDGCDYYPGQSYDTCFMYEYNFPAGEWFYQEPGPTVYWISIGAIYMTPPTSNQWGWKTREHFYNDAAVRIFMPVLPMVGTIYQAGEPIEEPQNNPWDMAFQILTVEVTPTPIPTMTPTVEPTMTPTVEPTMTPTVEPTATATTGPSPTPRPIPATDRKGISILLITLTILITFAGVKFHR